MNKINFAFFAAVFFGGLFVFTLIEGLRIEKEYEKIVIRYNDLVKDYNKLATQNAALAAAKKWFWE